MICETCGTEYIVLGGMRKCPCTCGGEHMVCRTCREALVAQGFGRYEDTIPGFFIELCPTAVKVARQMMRDDAPIAFKPKRLSQKAKIEMVERVVLNHFVEEGKTISLLALAEKLRWLPSRVRSVINKADAVTFKTWYGSTKHLYRPTEKALRDHIKELRAALREKEGEPT